LREINQFLSYSVRGLIFAIDRRGYLSHTLKKRLLEINEKFCTKKKEEINEKFTFWCQKNEQRIEISAHELF